MLDPVLMEQLGAPVMALGNAAIAKRCRSSRRWPVEAFLDECARSTAENVREAAAVAKAQKYRKWQPL